MYFLVLYIAMLYICIVVQCELPRNALKLKKTNIENNNDMNNKIEERNKYLVRKVSIIDTMRKLPFDKAIEFDALECGPVSTARSAATRLAQNGEGKWLVDSDNNGVTYTIVRKS